MIAFLFEPPRDDPKAWKKVMGEEADRVLGATSEALSGMDRFTEETVEAALAPLPGELDLKPGKVFQPIRVAITGGTVSPGIFESVAALGQDRTLERIADARGRIASGATGPSG